jgi:hypothetical protein
VFRTLAEITGRPSGDRPAVNESIVKSAAGAPPGTVKRPTDPVAWRGP